MKIDKKRFLALTALLSSSAVLGAERTLANTADDPDAMPRMSASAMARARSRCLALCDQVVKPACEQACRSFDQCSDGQNGTCDNRVRACREYHCELLADPAVE